VVVLLAEFRALSLEQQRQFRSAIRPAAQSFGLGVRVRRAEARNQHIRQLLGSWYAAGAVPHKPDWSAVRRAVDPSGKIQRLGAARVPQVAAAPTPD
jgi:hypothetical protein